MILTQKHSLPVIVPPTWNKSQYHSEISQVWRKAAEELSEAEIIFIIGYSLPKTDMFFRFLYGLGTFSKTHLSKIIVINPDKDSEDAFRSMIGQGLIDRRFEFWNDTFAKALPKIKEKIIEIIK